MKELLMKYREIIMYLVSVSYTHLLVLLILTNKLDHTPLLSLADFESFSNQLSPFYGYYVSTDTIMPVSYTHLDVYKRQL